MDALTAQVQSRLMESQRDPVMQALRLAAIVEGSDDAIVSKDTNGIITSWNRAAERMFRWTAEEAIGQSIRLIIPPDRQSEEDMVLARIRRGERVEPFETVRCRKDGERFDVSVSISPIRTADGRIVGASKIARDITEWKRTTRALQDARAEQAELRRRLAGIIDASGALLQSPRLDDVLPAILAVSRQVLTADGVAVWYLDAHAWRVAAAHGLSDAFTSVVLDEQAGPDLGDGVLMLESITDARFGSRLDVYARERIESMLLVPLRAGDGMRATIAFYFRTRQQFGLVERETAAALGRLSSVAIATASLYDAQRRRRIEAAFFAETGSILAGTPDLREALRHLVDRVVPAFADACAVHLVGEVDGIELVAEAGQGGPGRAEGMLRAQAGEADDLFSVDRVIRTSTGMTVDRFGAPGYAGYAEVRIAMGRALGQPSIACVPLVAHGRTLGALTLLATASGRGAPRPDLAFVQDLAYRVALSVDSMLSYEDARTANRLKDDFLANLSHELRTPLNAIRGYAQMLMKGAVAEDRKGRAYEVLDKNASALSQIVDDVLDTARITAGKLQLHSSSVALEPIVRHSVETVQPAADAKGVTVGLESEAGLPDVSGDPDRLQQVFWNLLSNAVKFTSRGGRVDVRLICHDGLCEVAVRDTGIGIDRRVLPHVFERFRQGDGRFVREYGGLGLGLAIARQLVEMHGGSIVAESDGPGQGATFRVTLPALSS
ncbi:MAG: ATP-binding protein [Vicinamibacterales bacterium]